MAQTMAHHHVREGDAILTQGEPSRYLHIVISGSYRLVRVMDDGRRQVTGFVFPGDYVGTGAARTSSHTAEALEPSLVCKFSHSFLDEMSERFPGIKDRLIARGDTELTKAQDHIVLLGKQTAEEKVISFLNSLAARGNGVPGEGARLYLPMSRQDIADYLGLRLETLSRALTTLKKNGAITSISGRMVELAEHPALVE